MRTVLNLIPNLCDLLPKMLVFCNNTQTTEYKVYSSAHNNYSTTVVEVLDSTACSSLILLATKFNASLPCVCVCVCVCVYACYNGHNIQKGKPLTQLNHSGG